VSVTIRIKPGTRDYLRETCRAKETYDDVINRLIIELADARDAIKSLMNTIAELEAAMKGADG